MGVYSRYKRTPEGFRALVELLESTPSARRQKMVDAGMADDPEFTQKALQYMMVWDDIVKMNDLELAELMSVSPARTIAFALKMEADDTLNRFIRNCKPQIGAEVKSYHKTNVGPTEVGGAKLKLISIARDLERKGLLRTKMIPLVVT